MGPSAPATDSTSHPLAALANITHLQYSAGTMLLGVPIDAPNSATAVNTHLGRLLASYETTVDRIGRLPDAQCAHSLLRSCLGPAKILYALRTCSLAHTSPFARNVSELQCHCFGGILGLVDQISDICWAQACLPIRAGGCVVGDPVQEPQLHAWPVYYSLSKRPTHA